MSVFLLDNSLFFPPVELSREDGLLAVGGDLSPERLLLAYRQGIFPWYNPGDPILWWSPDPRLILEPERLHVPRRLRRVIASPPFEITFDKAFNEVIRSCAQVRREKGEGTWLTGEMIHAYCRLHRLGYAHSAEAWRHGELVGGLYGVAMGRAFFGESMFHRARDASKVAFVALVGLLKHWDFPLIDCQVVTAHLLRFGARTVPRREFITWLEVLVNQPSGAPAGEWSGITAHEFLEDYRRNK